MSEQRFKLDSDDENEPSEFFTDYGDFWEDGTPKTYWFDDYEDFEDIVDLLNKQQATIKKLEEENRELRQKIKHWVYVDVDNGKGCMNCKYDIGSICSILDCGTHDYLMGVSECGLKYWESLI